VLNGNEACPDYPAGFICFRDMFLPISSDAMAAPHGRGCPIRIVRVGLFYST